MEKVMFMYKMTLTTSPTTWTSGSLFGFGGSGNQVVYGNGVYVAIGIGTYTMYYSADGKNWTGVSSPSSILNFIPNNLAFNNNQWIVVGYDNTGGGGSKTIYYSSNGTTWTSANGTPFGAFVAGQTKVGGTFVKFVNNAWYAVGFTSNVQSGHTELVETTLITSTDGVNWANACASNQTGLFSNTITGFDYANGIMVVIGESSSGNNVIYTTQSSPPFTFASATGNPFGIGGIGVKILNNGDRWVAIGSVANGTSTNILWYSNNGRDWNPVPNNLFGVSGATVGSCLSHYGPTWVAGAKTGAASSCYSIDNGLTWALGPQINGGVNGVEFANTKWVLVGTDTSFNSILYSSDGINWSGLTGTNSFPQSINSVTYGPGRWVAVGNASDKVFQSDQNASYSNVFIYVAPACFLEDTKILTENGYVKVQNLRPGDKVKTVKNGFVPVHSIGSKTFYNPNIEERTKDQLYVCSPKNYPELTEDLVITGCHSVLVDKFKNAKQENESVKVLGMVYVTDGYLRLPACVDDRSEVYDQIGDFTVYHFALENNDYFMNYGVYANGLLVETTSKRYLLELSGMKLIEN